MIKPVKWKANLTVLTEQEIEQIHRASLRILSETGVLMPLRAARYQQLQESGVRVDQENNRVFFPRDIVEKALQSVPPVFTLAARNPANDLVVDGTKGFLTLDGCGLQILDPNTHQVRKTNKADLGNAVRVADYLPQISFLWPCISAQDCNPALQPLHELQVMLLNSGKHIQAMTAVDPLNAQGSVEIAAAVLGGKEELKKRPIISNFQCSISPLSYDEKGLEAAFIFAAAGIPVGFMTMQIGCSTAPATLAGNIALGNAEILAGIIVLQLLYPGAPTFYGSCATVMELKRGGVTCGGPEDFLLQAASAQMAAYYHIPCNVGTFATGAKASDWHAGVENAISGAVSVFARSDMMCGAGLTYGARIFSFEQLLLDCEIFDILKTVAEGIVVDETTLALEVIKAVGPRNHYMTQEHTLKHLRQMWQPAIIDRSPYEEWLGRGKPAPDVTARALAKEILATHRPEPLPAAEKIAEIIAYYEKTGAQS